MLQRLSPLVLCWALTGSCLAADGDPLERLNRVSHGFNRGLDRLLLKPVAQGYRAFTPGFFRRGVGNFFANLGDVRTAVNQVFQGKPMDGLNDATRFLVNSTFGIVGVFDVASGGGLTKHTEDFGQTMAVWGVASGPYLEIPVLGPSNFRDGFGFFGDTFLAPLRYVENVPLRNSLIGLRTVNLRYQLLGGDALLEGDTYELFRDVYEQRRESLIRDGGGDDPFLDDPFLDEDL